MAQHAVLRALLAATVLWAGGGRVNAQTPLFPGDLAIVGINANNGGCSGVSAQDEISFICFKPLTVNTVIIVTDNGYERQNAGLWGDNEGVVRFQLTAGPIPAGTVITFRNPGAGLPVMVSPAASTWSVISMNGGFTLNMNSGGDQIFFLQPGVGGTWSAGTGATNDGFFTNCTILYAFNTKNLWSAVNTTQDSGLPPGSLCFSMNPTAATDFVKYTDAVLAGAFTTRTQRAWLIDIDNAANWATFGACGTYNSGAPNYAAGFTFPITGSSFQNGLWTGAKTQDWFDCRNWDDAEVPNAASNVVINQTKIQNCVVGLNGTTPLTAQCATLSLTSNNAVQPTLTINNGRQLVVSGGASIIRTAAATPISITVLNGSFTSASLTLLGSAPAAQNAIFYNQAPANTVQVNGDVQILSGGSLNLINGSLNLTGNFRDMDALAAGTAFFELNSTVLFNGGGPQSIMTTGFEEFFSSLRVNKSADDLTLSAPITVSGNLDLLQGRVFSSSTNLLSVGMLGSATNASNSSFVSGPVEKVGNTSFTFPIGKNTNYRPASLTGVTGLANHSFIAEYFPAPLPNPPAVLFGPTLAPTLDHISECEYWQIDRSFGTPNAFVTLSWDAASSCGVTLPADLRVARWNGALWEDRGNSGTTGTLLSGTVISGTQQTQFSPWTLASVSAQNPLPIELMYFLARPDGSLVKLDWATASELNNDRFTVERSADGITFQPVLARPGAGNSSSVIEYTDHDRAPLPGVSYYRLRQTDIDGVSTVSPIVAVRFDASSSTPLQVLYGSDELIAVHSFSTGARYEFMDLMGQVVRSGAITREGRTALAVDDLAHGAYVLRISDGQRVQSVQFVR